jgi:hypothetical protein
MRTRRVLLVVLGLAALLPGLAFAQYVGADLPPYLAPPSVWQPQWSVQRNATLGVFTTELDAAFTAYQTSAGPSFSDLKSPFVFGGLDNLYGGKAVSTNPGGSTATPFYAGVYMPGSVPWSVYSYLNHTGVAGEAAHSIVYAPASYTVGTDTYNWMQQQTELTNQARPFLGINNDYAQALVGFGQITTGLGVKLNIQDLATPATNSTSVLTRNYNSTPAAAPAPLLDYTITTTQTNAGGSTADLAFSIPLFFKTNMISHYGLVGFEVFGADGSSSLVTTQTNPKDPAGGVTTYTDFNNSTINKGSTYQVPLAYALFLPALVKGNDKNQFIVGVDGFVNIAAGQYALVNTSQLWNYPGAGGASTKGVATYTDDNRTYNPGISMKVGAGATHSLYFEPASGVHYGIVPSVYMDYAHLVNGAELKSITTVVKTDANNNGVFTDNGDSSVTTTTTYVNALTDAAGIATTDQFEFVFSMPMVLKLTPPGAIFGFTLSTTPQAYYQFLGNSTLSRQKSDSVTTAVVGAAPTTTTTVFAPTNPSSTVSHNWTFQAVHTLGINFLFFEKVKLDVNVNFVTVAGSNGGAGLAPAYTSNLFDINNLTIQATVPLS